MPYSDSCRLRSHSVAAGCEELCMGGRQVSGVFVLEELLEPDASDAGEAHHTDDGSEASERGARSGARSGIGCWDRELHEYSPDNEQQAVHATCASDSCDAEHHDAADGGGEDLELREYSEG